MQAIKQSIQAFIYSNFFSLDHWHHTIPELKAKTRKHENIKLNMSNGLYHLNL